ncbi:type II secretion system F family protein [Candidatus Woesearchaeota archaeon]|nr:type II secretion system F family protein [Candidatus Woesearchaeota archaeon]
MINFKKEYFVGISLALVLLVLDVLFLRSTRWFIAIIIVSINIGWLQFWIDFFREQNRQKEIDTKFLEFVRNLVSTAKSGLSIPRAIIQASGEDYGALTPYVRKLSHQVEWGVPVEKALLTFAKDTRNAVISRSVSIVIEASKAGGDIENVLDSVTDSVMYVKKIKQERKSGTYSQIVQGYIVFFIFIAIMLVLQLWLFPQFSNLKGLGQGGSELAGSLGTGAIFGEGKRADIDSIFFSLILVQGFFSGVMIGAFSEGSVKRGLLHSLVLMTLATLIITTAKGGI